VQTLEGVIDLSPLFWANKLLGLLRIVGGLGLWRDVIGIRVEQCKRVYRAISISRCIHACEKLLMIELLVFLAL
jgi:hypothetical protein